MAEFSGSCLCGDVSYKGAQDEIKIVNCHCTDCQQASGAAYMTNLFIAQDNIRITGAVTTYRHKADSGNDMVKHNCTACGSPVYGTNSGRPGVVVLRAGTLDQKAMVQPKITVFTDSKMPATPIDPAHTTFPRMPG